MIQWLINLLYGSTSLELESAYSLEESVARLRAATKQSAFSALAEQAAVGKVTTSHVKLQRVIPMLGNSFKPFFIGQFTAREGRVFLSGKFTMLAFAKYFMSFWFGCLVIIAIAANASLFLKHAAAGSRAAFVFGPAGMFAAGIGMVWLGKWLSRNDVQWLTDTMRQILGGGAGRQAPALAASGNLRAGSRPTILTITAVILSIMGALDLVVAVSGLPVGSLNANVLVADISPITMRYIIGAEGGFILAVAAGVSLRSRVAWSAGFVLLASAWAWSAVNISFLADAAGSPMPFRIAFLLVSFVVVLVWGRWWYAMRIHFRPDTENGVLHNIR